MVFGISEVSSHYSRLSGCAPRNTPDMTKGADTPNQLAFTAHYFT